MRLVSCDNCGQKAKVKQYHSAPKGWAEIDIVTKEDTVDDVAETREIHLCPDCVVKMPSLNHA